MVKGKGRENGKDQTEISLRVSISRISKTVGGGLLGQMEKYMKASSETIFVMVKALIDTQMVKLESSCGLMGK